MEAEENCDTRPIVDSSAILADHPASVVFSELGLRPFVFENLFRQMTPTHNSLSQGGVKTQPPRLFV